MATRVVSSNVAGSPTVATAVSAVGPPMSAEDWKTRGNKYFFIRKFTEANMCYAKALQMKPDNVVLLCNKVLCHLRCQEWDLAQVDARRAVGIDPFDVKGHYLLGLALIELQNYDEAMVELRKSQDLARDQRVFVGDEAATAIRTAKKRRWAAAEEHTVAKEAELRSQLEKLIEQDKQTKLTEVAGPSNEIRNQSEAERVEAQTSETLRQMESLFNTLELRRRRVEVPDFLCDRISFELMRDPVITPSGITYDRKQIEEHLQRVGHFDPVTRAPLTIDQLVPNLALKEVIDAFLEENPWAEEF